MPASTDYQRTRSPLAEGSGRPSPPAALPASNSAPPFIHGNGDPSRPRPRPQLPAISVPTTTSPPPMSPTRAQTHRGLGLPSPSAGPSSVPHASPSHAHASTPPPHVRGSTADHRATPTTSYSASLPSPCFIHSHLDDSLTDFVKRDGGSAVLGLSGSGLGTSGAGAAGKRPRTRSTELAREPSARKSPARGVARAAVAERGAPGSEEGSSTAGESGMEEEQVASDEELDEEDELNSLTRRLAETAVSVREMSKQLGQARVVSHIQSVMIVTKARDNQLTRLTRELALWLMKTPRNGKDRGLIVYVDSQLRKSKRFDASGMEKEHPELFRPFPHRRYSRTSSSTSLATDVASTLSHRRTSGPVGTMTPVGGGTITPLTMTNVNNVLLSRNNSLSSEKSEAHPARKGEEGREGQLRYWTNDMCRKSPHLFDFVITLGGDGTVLYTSWLFQHIVPPVIPFALGSLGFLTNFDYSNFRQTLTNAIEDGVRVNLRMRFTCTVYRAVNDDEACKRRAVRSGKTGEIFMQSLTKEGWEAIESGRPPQGAPGGGKDKEIKCFSTRAVESFEVLNDLVVDRGPSPYVSQLELFGDEHHMTTVQADGLTIATPTGSTAYSLSAGGSLVHPEIPAILITPICPHTLSFRPMLLPDSMELRICVPYNSRSTAWASFDGRGRVELRQGDHIKVTASPYPFPTVCADKQSTDWFHAISRTLKWNERQRQKSFVILEEGRKKPKNTSSPATERPAAFAVPSSPSALKKNAKFEDHSNAPAEDDDEGTTSAGDEGENGSEEEEEFDIDDLSETTTTNASSPSVAPSDPPTSSAIPALLYSGGSHSEPSTPTMTPASAVGPALRDRERDLSSGSSSVSVDIQDDEGDRFRDPVPMARNKSRTRSRDAKRKAKEQAERGDEKSQDKAFAFAVVGNMDSDSSISGSDHD
ncbi:hypothetical protein JCM21900_001111 [Sporobolomyces salmonicolor]